MKTKQNEIIKQLDYLNETFGIDLLSELIEIFKQQKIDLLISWRSRNDLSEDEIKHSAHKIKSSARNVGASDIGAIFQSIESNSSQAIVKSQISTIEMEFDFYIQTYQNWLKEKESYEQDTDSRRQPK